MKIAIVIFLWKCVYASDVPYIPETWVDPNDMRYYDRHTKSMKSSYISSKENIESASIANNTVADLHNLVNDVKRYEIFLERFINHFLQTANLKNKIFKPDTRINAEIPVLITSEELSRLITLSQSINCSKLNELDELFSVILNHDRGFSFDSLTPYLNPVQQLFYGMSWEKVTIIVYIIMFGSVLWMFAVGRELKRIMLFVYLIFFMAGLAWNWWNMYQEAVVEQFVEMQKLSEIPDVCIPKKTSFFSFMFSFSEDKECERYHKSFRIDPFSKIPPTIVLSETISAMLIYPLKTLGSGVGEFLTGISRAAPWPFNILFIPFVVLISTGFILCVLTILLGIKVNFWTLFGGVSIGGKISGENPVYPKVSDEITLNRTIEYENEQSYVLIQVGMVRKYLQDVRKEQLQLKNVSEIGHGDSTCTIQNHITHPITEENGVADLIGKEQSNSILELFKCVSRNKIQSNRINYNRFKINKKKYK